MTTWWEEHNALVREHGVGVPLLDDAMTLLDDVEAAFAVTGAATPGWSSPDVDRSDSSIYERVTEPERFEIAAARAEAWGKVLTARGWATSWTRGIQRVLVPARRAAVPMVFHVKHNHGATFVTVGVGDPPFMLQEHPDCACDGCDMGSESLLRGIDEDIFSVVDGSLEVVEGGGRRTLRTSFSGSHSTTSKRGPVRGVSGGPWGTDWAPRRLIKMSS